MPGHLGDGWTARISATFRLAYGFPGAGMMGGVFLAEIVTLPNVSTPDDPVGYTCRGIVKIPRDTPGLAGGRLTVKAERVDPTDPHMAFNKESVALRIGRGVAGAAKLRTAGPAAFASNGVLIEGSHWCRSPGQCLEWQWSPIHDVGRVQEAAINLSLVVTNKTNGGSGYSARVIVQVLALDGTNIFSSFVDLKNPFLPEFPGDSKGVGYAAYGALELPPDFLSQYGSQGFKVRIEWPPMRSDYHFAGAKASALLAWTEAQ